LVALVALVDVATLVAVKEVARAMGVEAVVAAATLAEVKEVARAIAVVVGMAAWAAAGLAPRITSRSLPAERPPSATRTLRS
jgi:hypothetical protein